ncbi:hypothetical protein HNQ94_000204 [Salirhabdus euzebyi]|uniref:Uncharacterized protein n=1 Tax=Salirhabdus euzebyi TaxID=394506 RepID=A0A841Q162_9BACI|nr:hypothetical protein [Salirhabdus euzebyi]MBB6451783.1 hypothetical protein [Salirhabdus euzebyi]
MVIDFNELIKSYESRTLSEEEASFLIMRLESILNDLKEEYPHL